MTNTFFRQVRHTTSKEKVFLSGQECFNTFIIFPSLPIFGVPADNTQIRFEQLNYV